jgi:hypothetical protein
MWNGVRFVLSVLVLAAAGPLARADTLHIGEEALVTLTGVHAGVKSMTFHYGSTTITDFVGEYAWKPSTTPTNNPWPLNQPFESFCVDLNEFVQLNHSYDYTIQTVESSPNPDPGSPTVGMGTARADALRRLWGTYRTGAQNDDLKAAAFQMAIWEIVFETPTQSSLPTLDVRSGTFKMDTGSSTAGNLSGQTISWNSIATEANTYLYNVFYSIGTKAESNLVVLSMPGGQDQLVVMPIPAAAYGGTLLLGVLGGFRKARRRLVA